MRGIDEKKKAQQVMNKKELLKKKIKSELLQEKSQEA